MNHIPKGCGDCAWLHDNSVEWLHGFAAEREWTCSVVEREDFGRGCPGCTYEEKYHEDPRNFRDPDWEGDDFDRVNRGMFHFFKKNGTFAELVNDKCFASMVKRRNDVRDEISDPFMLEAK